MFEAPGIDHVSWDILQEAEGMVKVAGAAEQVQLSKYMV